MAEVRAGAASAARRSVRATWLVPTGGGARRFAAASCGISRVAVGLSGAPRAEDFGGGRFAAANFGISRVTLVVPVDSPPGAALARGGAGGAGGGGDGRGAGAAAGAAAAFSLSLGLCFGAALELVLVGRIGERYEALDVLGADEVREKGHELERIENFVSPFAMRSWSCAFKAPAFCAARSMIQRLGR